VTARGRGPSLFAYPAQSNFTGVQHSLTWIQEAHDQGSDVLLDAAALVPCHRLDLSLWHPDFVALSFYKMFGYPTGVGVSWRAARSSRAEAPGVRGRHCRYRKRRRRLARDGAGRSRVRG
jgi:selenocysteine lyase/cysteine desulfurase